jgi:rRNA maturation protein Nop10
MSKPKERSILKKCPKHAWIKQSYTAYHECSVCGQRRADRAT